MNELDFRRLLAERGATHWWHAGMRRITWAMLGPVQGRVLDMGCGPGWELAELPPVAQGIGIDLRPVRAIPGRFVAADAVCLPFPAATFDLALALDLLEQTAVQPAAALHEAYRVLRPGGRLLIRVPAHPWLFGPHDAFWGGARRYRRADLADLVTEAGFNVRRLTYANALLFPWAAAGRLLARATASGGDDLRPLPASLNQCLGGILALEAHWLRKRDLPIGLSLLCLAEKPSG